MSDTPRTNLEAFFPHKSMYQVCDADFTRQLERELIEANGRIEALNRGNAAAERILCELTGCESGRDIPDWIVAAKERIKRWEQVRGEAKP